MVDIHSHLLPELDDGAGSFETSIDIINSAVGGNFTDIICTPHFSPEEQELEEFLKLRDLSFNKLKTFLEQNSIPLSLHLGMEISFSPELIVLIDSLKKESGCETKIRQLCLAQSRYMLLEFSPFTFPIWAERCMYELQLRGINPVIAHVERYSWVLREKSNLLKWAENGVAFQINASCLDVPHSNKPSKTVAFLLNNGLINVIASDAHNNNERNMTPLINIFNDRGKIKYNKIKGWIENGFNILNNNDIIHFESF